MKGGRLSEHFEGVAVKTLSSVEADGSASNQHEFNGVGCLRNILGVPDGKARFNANFIYLSGSEEDEGGLVSDTGTLTWYDARQKAREERGVMREEYRLYFTRNKVLDLAKADDLLVIAKRTNNDLLAIVSEASSTYAHQLLWLFGLSAPTGNNFNIQGELDGDQRHIGFTAQLILEALHLFVWASNPAPTPSGYSCKPPRWK